MTWDQTWTDYPGDGTAASTAILTAADLNDIVTEIKKSTNVWAAYTPTLTWGTAAPASITTVARWVRVGVVVHFHIDISSADSNATDSLTISLPADPVDNNDRTAVTAIQKAGAGGVTYSNPLAYIDMDSASKLIKFYSFTTGTDGQAIALIVSGSYEVA